VLLLRLAVLHGLSGVDLVDDRKVPNCETVRCSGKRITSDLGFLRFCVPRGVKVQQVHGEHGDVHYTLTIRNEGRSYELYFVSGPYFTGRDPSQGGLKWSARPWTCGEFRGEDYRLNSEDKRSRYITLNDPVGYAVYRDLPEKTALRFDKILDSLCCGDCIPCARDNPKSSR
jgi:hypothetical protein